MSMSYLMTFLHDKNGRVVDVDQHGDVIDLFRKNVDGPYRVVREGVDLVAYDDDDMFTVRARLSPVASGKRPIRTWCAGVGVKERLGATVAEVVAEIESADQKMEWQFNAGGELEGHVGPARHAVVYGF